MFSTNLRTKARVRASGADDLAVIDSQAERLSWLADTHGALCLQCGAKIPMADSVTMAESMRAHRGGCGR